jgi:ABC-type glycerol-3-phosphate transport system substrate-binding protein
MYHANGGDVIDDNGRAFLDAETLAQVLGYYAEAEQSGVMPYWLTQYQSDDQAWEAFLEDRNGQVVSWASSFLMEPLEDLTFAALPTPDGEPFTLASGWVWALTTPSAQDQQLSVELAEFLTDGIFLAQWTSALGYLPVRPSSLIPESEQAQSEMIERVVLSATIFPPKDIWDSVSIPLQQATVEVLKQQTDPVTAAQSAAASLAVP